MQNNLRNHYTYPNETQDLLRFLEPVFGQGKEQEKMITVMMELAGRIRRGFIFENIFGRPYPRDLKIEDINSLTEDQQIDPSEFMKLFHDYEIISEHTSNLATQAEMRNNSDKGVVFLDPDKLSKWVMSYTELPGVHLSDTELFGLGIATVYALSYTNHEAMAIHGLEPGFFLGQRGFSLKKDEKEVHIKEDTGIRNFTPKSMQRAILETWNQHFVPHREVTLRDVRARA